MTDAERRRALSNRIFQSTLGALELFHVYLGDALGLYDALAAGAATAPELAAAAGIAPRYAREWLEQQAVAGFIDVVEASDVGDARRYAIPAGHLPVLVDRTHLSHNIPLAHGAVGVAQTLPMVMDAFRTGGGVAYETYGANVRGCVSRVNRPMFMVQLGRNWFPSVVALDERLRAEPPARVVDVGCGTGWSSIGIALAYPSVSVVGLDLDAPSIDEARRNADAEGVADRVSFEARDAADPALTAGFDIACAFETIHDMANPVGVLRAMHGLVAEDGFVLVADERVADEFVAPGDEIERFHYAWSSVHCLPVGLPGAGTGAVMRPATLLRHAQEAGFADVVDLPVEHPLWRFYRLFR